MPVVDRDGRRPGFGPRPRPRGARARRGVAALGTIVVTLGSAASAAAAVSSVGGGAYGLRANVNAVLAPTSVGALPSVTLPAEGGGPYGESLLSGNSLGLAPLSAATVSTEGNSGIGWSRSSASVVGATLAGVVTVSSARSRCSASVGEADGSVSVSGLVVAGVPVATVDAGPNTVIALPVGTVTVNEQRRLGTSEITVNAVRVRLDAGVVTGTVVLAQSRCEVNSSTRARAKLPRRTRRTRKSR